MSRGHALLSYMLTLPAPRSSFPIHRPQCPQQHLSIHHSLISSQLQRSAAHVADGKVKGLFCILPRNGVQAFISYGLHCQPVPVKGSTYPQSASQNISSSSSSCGTDGVPCKTGLPTLFEVNWLWASHEDNDDMTENTASERDDSSALKYTHKMWYLQ